MGLLSFLKRKSTDAARAPAAAEPPDTLQQIRVRARQRLVGSIILVTAGVIGFSLLFETQPRPLQIDTPIEIIRRDSSASVVPMRPLASGRPAIVVPPSVITESSSDAGRAVPSPAPPALEAPAPAVTAPAPEPVPQSTASAHAPAPEPHSKPAAPKPTPAAEEPPAAKPAATAVKPADSTRAQALLNGQADVRFIVQVGAFSDTNAAREARHRVEKLGLKTYTQVVETSAGNRIRVRVGPFASRDEADKAASKIKSAGLTSAVFTL